MYLALFRTLDGCERLVEIPRIDMEVRLSLHLPVRIRFEDGVDTVVKLRSRTYRYMSQYKGNEGNDIHVYEEISMDMDN